MTVVEATPAVEEIQRLLYREARLLDEGRFDEWLELFTDDGIYWIPFDPADDPLRDTSILYDDSELRQQRVFWLMQTQAHSQVPPSITVHVVANVEVTAGDDSCCEVAAALVAHEVRGGDDRQDGLGDQRVWPARLSYTLRREDGAWRIAKKTVLLSGRGLPVTNLTFIL